MTSTPRLIPRIPVLAILASAIACGDPVTTAPLLSGLEPGAGAAAAASSTDDPIVDSVDPPSAPQDTTLDVEVRGDNFDRGSTVQFALDTEPTDEITTNETRFVNKRKLIANITIAADAAEDLYDVVVITSGGRKGIGLEMFEVTRTGNPNDPIITVNFLDPEDDTDPLLRVFSDGGGSYIDQVDGVAIDVARQFGLAPHGDSKPGQSDVTRRVCLRFTADQEVTGAGIPEDLADDLDGTGRTCVTGGLLTVWHSNGDLGLEGMTLGETIRAEARYIWTDGENNQFKLEFFCRDDRGGDDGTTACENLVDVTLVEETATSRTWRLSFDPARVAPLSRNFVKGAPNPFEVLAAFHMPFDLTVRVDDG